MNPNPLVEELGTRQLSENFFQIVGDFFMFLAGQGADVQFDRTAVGYNIGSGPAVYLVDRH